MGYLFLSPIVDFIPVIIGILIYPGILLSPVFDILCFPSVQKPVCARNLSYLRIPKVHFPIFWAIHKFHFVQKQERFCLSYDYVSSPLPVIHKALRPNVGYSTRTLLAEIWTDVLAKPSNLQAKKLSRLFCQDVRRCLC